MNYVQFSLFKWISQNMKFMKMRGPSRAMMFSRPGQSQGLLNKHLRHWFIHSFIDWVSEPFPPRALRRRHAQTVRDCSSSYKIEYVIVIKTFLNPEGYQNRISGLKVTVILLKGWILPIGEYSAVEGLRSTGLPRLVFFSITIHLSYFVWNSMRAACCDCVAQVLPKVQKGPWTH